MTSLIIGSGLLATAFSTSFSARAGICIYAAGVSNSGCTDVKEFVRERLRLEEALSQISSETVFVYFGTCSIADPDLKNAPYVLHKLAMENIAREHPLHLILRLPQVVGKTPNPHTLLNFLFSRISRSEGFKLWHKAKRNIIDVADVVKITEQLLMLESSQGSTFNIANTSADSVADIVKAMESALGKPAVFEDVDLGSEYAIDTSAIVPLLSHAGVCFDSAYLQRVVNKYYRNV